MEYEYYSIFIVAEEEVIESFWDDSGAKSPPHAEYWLDCDRKMQYSIEVHTKHRNNEELFEWISSNL